MTQPLTHTATPPSPFPGHERILLINADDLGLSPEANGAIDELFACGITELMLHPERPVRPAARPVLMRQSGCTNTGSCSIPIFAS